VHALNQRLSPGIDEEELVSVLRSLAASGNRELPPNFVTKGQATKRGWRPGRDLWEVPDLRLWDVLSADIEGPIEVVWKDPDSSRIGVGGDFDRILAVLKSVEKTRKDFRLRLGQER